MGGGFSESLNWDDQLGGRWLGVPGGAPRVEAGVPLGGSAGSRLRLARGLGS